MRLFLLQGSLRNEHGEVAVLHTQFLNLTVKEVFNGFPDGVGPGPQHITAAHIIILNHLCFSDDLWWGQHYIERSIFNRRFRKDRTFFLFIMAFLEVEKGLVRVKGAFVYQIHLRVPVSQVLLFLGLQTQPARTQTTKLVWCKPWDYATIHNNFVFTILSRSGDLTLHPNSGCFTVLTGHYSNTFVMFSLKDPLVKLKEGVMKHCPNTVAEQPRKFTTTWTEHRYVTSCLSS